MVRWLVLKAGAKQWLTAGRGEGFVFVIVCGHCDLLGWWGILPPSRRQGERDAVTAMTNSIKRFESGLSAAREGAAAIHCFFPPEAQRFAGTIHISTNRLAPATGIR